jgi:hypothetical protein
MAAGSGQPLVVLFSRGRDWNNQDLRSTALNVEPQQMLHGMNGGGMRSSSAHTLNLKGM